jgi:hypothetical protein
LLRFLATQVGSIPARREVVRPAQKGRRHHARLLVYYRSSQLRPGDLLFDGEQPILVIRWRTINRKRVPDITGPLSGTQARPVLWQIVTSGVTTLTLILGCQRDTPNPSRTNDLMEANDAV